MLFKFCPILTVTAAAVSPLQSDSSNLPIVDATRMSRFAHFVRSYRSSCNLQPPKWRFSTIFHKIDHLFTLLPPPHKPSQDPVRHPHRYDSHTNPHFITHPQPLYFSPKVEKTSKLSHIHSPLPKRSAQLSLWIRIQTRHLSNLFPRRHTRFFPSLTCVYNNVQNFISSKISNFFIKFYSFFPILYTNLIFIITHSYTHLNLQ